MEVLPNENFSNVVLNVQREAEAQTEPPRRGCHTNKYLGVLVITAILAVMASSFYVTHRLTLETGKVFETSTMEPWTERMDSMEEADITTITAVVYEAVVPVVTTTITAVVTTTIPAVVYEMTTPEADDERHSLIHSIIEDISRMQELHHTADSLLKCKAGNSALLASVTNTTRVMKARRAELFAITTRLEAEMRKSIESCQMTSDILGLFNMVRMFTL